MGTDRDTQTVGLFGALLDRSFDVSVTLGVLRVLYTLAAVCTTAVNVLFFLTGWSLAAGSFLPTLGWLIVIGIPPMWLGELIMIRVVVEYLAVQHKISADLTVIRNVLTHRPGSP